MAAALCPFFHRFHSSAFCAAVNQIRDDNNLGTAELGFICIEKDGSRNFGGTLLPFEGTYENAQDEVVVLIHKGRYYASPDLSQKWQNTHDYSF